VSCINPCMRGEWRTVEQLLDQMASQAYGVVTRIELLEAGVSSTGIERRVRKGLLIPQYRGVYRVGHTAPSVEATYLGAVKACGRAALLYGQAGAYLLGLVKTEPPPGPEVAAPTQRRIPGIRTRRDRRGSGLDAIVFRGIPVTSVARTLVDAADGTSESQLARMVHQAGVLHRTTPAQVKAVLARRPTSPGAARIRAILEGDSHVTLSELERLFLERLRAASLPLPITNRTAGSRRVDCRWPDHRLTVELDSFQFHNSRYAWEQDRAREREARARKDEFRRYTWADVQHPRLMLSDIRRLLETQRPP
jgi:hypothetical protein